MAGVGDEGLVRLTRAVMAWSHAATWVPLSDNAHSGWPLWCHNFISRD